MSLLWACKNGWAGREGKGEALGVNAGGGGADRHWVGGGSQFEMPLAPGRGAVGSQVGSGEGCVTTPSSTEVCQSPCWVLVHLGWQ